MLIRALCVVFLVGAALIGYRIWHIDESDRSYYQELVASSKPAKDTLIAQSQHARQGVSKMILYQSKTPLLSQIRSEESALSFIHRNEAIEVVEDLGEVSCIAQEELFYLLPDGQEAAYRKDGQLYLRGTHSLVDPDDSTLIPMQLVRLMEADSARYDYTSGHFIAHDARLWRYRLEGHEPDISIDTDQQFADHYALAERVTYLPEEQRMVLEGGKHRVLFYDRIQGMQLSAPTIYATRDSESQQDTIQGVGDVRFVFATEELEKLKKRFGHDLTR